MYNQPISDRSFKIGARSAAELGPCESCMWHGLGGPNGYGEVNTDYRFQKVFWGAMQARPSLIGLTFDKKLVHVPIDTGAVHIKRDATLWAMNVECLDVTCWMNQLMVLVACNGYVSLRHWRLDFSLHEDWQVAYDGDRPPNAVAVCASGTFVLCAVPTDKEVRVYRWYKGKSSEEAEVVPFVCPIEEGVVLDLAITSDWVAVLLDNGKIK